MIDLKLRPITPQGVPEALRMAKHYRLLNEPRAAESICEDVLAVQPHHQEATVTLLLAVTDQFRSSGGASIQAARQVLPRLHDAYQRDYYGGIICERWAKAQLDAHVPGYVVYEWLRHAMEHYDRAAKISPPNNDDAILRYNTCVRLIKRNTSIRPRPEDEQSVVDHGDTAPPM